MFSHTLEFNGSYYRIDAEMHRDSARDGVAATVITARWRSETSGNEERTAELLVRTDQEKNVLQVVHDKTVLGEINLDVHLPDKGPDTAAEDEVFLADLPTPSQIMTVIAAMDPIVGCLLKGAATSVGAQTIRCFQATPKSAPWVDRIKDTVDCLRSNGMSVARGFVIRVGKCLISLGFD